MIQIGRIKNKEMKITLKYIGSRVSSEVEVNGIRISLYQNIWMKIDVNEKILIELFDRDNLFEIKPFKFKITQKISTPKGRKRSKKIELGYDGVHFYKRNSNTMNANKMDLTIGDLHDLDLT